MGKKTLKGTNHICNIKKIPNSLSTGDKKLAPLAYESPWFPLKAWEIFKKSRNFLRSRKWISWNPQNNLKTKNVNMFAITALQRQLSEPHNTHTCGNSGKNNPIFWYFN